jgi:LacI family transcriptional regulator
MKIDQYGKLVTQKDIAEKVGVSVGTVDRALHNRGRIDEATKKKILDAANALDYKPNEMARSLRKQKSFRILAAYHREPETLTSYFKYGFDAAMRTLSDRGLKLDVLRAKSLDPQSMINAFETIDIKKYDAILLSAGGNELNGFIEHSDSMGIPVATFNSDSPTSKRLFFCGEDHYTAGLLCGELAGKMLQKKGRIALFSGVTSVYALRMRLEGFYAYVDKFYPEIKIVNNITHSDDETAYETGYRVLGKEDNRPDLVFCNSAAGAVILQDIIAKEKAPENLPVLITYDFNDKVKYLLENDYCHATIFQNPFKQAYSCIFNMYQYLLTKEIPTVDDCFIAPRIIMKNNMEECENINIDHL